MFLFIYLFLFIILSDWEWSLCMNVIILNINNSFLDLQQVNAHSSQKWDGICVFYLQKPVASVKRLAEFMGYTLSDSDLVKITHYSSFSQMKNSAASNYSWWDDLGIRNKTETPFLRKGIHKHGLDYMMYADDDQLYIIGLYSLMVMLI